MNKLTICATLILCSISCVVATCQQVESFYEYIETVDPVLAPSEIETESEGGIEHQINQINRAWGNRVFPDGTSSGISGNYLEYAYNWYNNPIEVSPSAWEPLGPTSSSTQWWGGKLNRITFHPNYGISNYRIYATSATGGLWKSEDRGVTWEVTGTDLGIPMTSCADVAAGKMDDGLVYIATGLPDQVLPFLHSPNNGTINPVHTLGVFKSTDFGDTWEWISDGLIEDFNDGGTCRRLVVNPSNDALLALATSRGVYICQNASGMQPTWERLQLPLQGSTEYDYRNFRGLEWKPNDSNILYASGLDIYRINTSTHVYESITGSTYNLDLNNLPIPTGSIDFHVEQINIAVTPAKPEWLYSYIIADYTNVNNGISYMKAYIYFFNGTEWKEIYSFSNPVNSGTVNAISPAMQSFAVHPVNPDQIYFGHTKVKGSVDIDFANIELEQPNPLLNFIDQSVYNNQFTRHADSRALCFEPYIPGIIDSPQLFEANDGGICVKDPNINGFGGWQSRSNGLNNHLCWSFDASDYNNKIVTVALQDNNTLAKNNNLIDQTQWQSIHSGIGDGYGSQISDNFERFLYMWGSGSNYSAQSKDFNFQNAIMEKNSSNTHPGQPDDVQHDQNNVPYKSPYPIGIQVAEPTQFSTYFGLSNLYERIDFNTGSWHDQWLLRANTFGTLSNPWINHRLIGSVAFNPSGTSAYYTTKSVGNTSELNGHYPYVGALYKVDNLLDIPNSMINQDLPTNVEDLTCNLLRAINNDPELFAGDCYIPNADPETLQYLKVLSAVTVSPANHDHVWVSYIGYDSNSKIWKSMDGGITWTNADPFGQLNNLPINDIIYHSSSNDRIYAATDAGVFELIIGTNEWKKYGDLPNVRVTELKIQACTNKLLCSTFGRGIWQTDLPPIQYQTEIIIADDEEWTVPKNLKSNIRVLNGNTLTISADAYMPSMSRIIVEPGATLVINDCTVTNRCDVLWQGVEVWGNDNLSQLESNQGKVVLNNATIENAHTGIWVRRNDDDCNLVQGTGGGIVHADNSTFKNCYVGVEFAPYRDFINEGTPNEAIIPNKSYFYKCNFITDRPLNQISGSQPYPKAGAILHDVFRVDFKACVFENQGVDNPTYATYYNTPHTRGDGIIGGNSVFSVIPVCDAPEPPPVGEACPIDDTRSLFRNLNHGIHAKAFNSLNVFKVDAADFESNVTGIRASGMGSESVAIRITRSDFIINDVVGIDPDQEPVGIDLRGVRNYEVSHNNFDGIDVSFNGIGVAITNTGDVNKNLYANSYQKLLRGVLAQGMNGSFLQQGVPKGTQVLCSSFGDNQAPSLYQNGIDIDMAKPYPAGGGNSVQTTLSNNQGHYSDEELISGTWNLFSGFCINADPTDWYVDPANDQGVSFIDYWTVTGDNELSCFEDSYIEKHTVSNELFDPEANCTGYYDHYYPQIGHTKTMLSEIVDELLDTKALYYGLLDNGDTQGLLNFINDPTNSSIAIRNEMISCIPFISMDAWRAAFDRNPSMNPWHLAQVLLDASPLKKEVQKLMDEFEMDPYYKTLVMNAQTGGFTSQDLLESDMAMLGQLKQHVRNSLAQKELFESNETRVIELLEIDVIDVIDPDLFLDAELSNLKDNHVQAAILLDDCGIGSNDEQICEALRQITLAERDADDCNDPHGSPLQSIELIATNPEHLGNSLARAYLEEKSIGSWESDLHPSIIIRSAQDQSSFSAQIGTSVIEVQPNPANDIVRFICNLPEGMNNVEIRLYDSQLRLFHIFSIGTGTSIQEVSIGNLSSGMYFFQLYSEDRHLESGKWQILH